MRRRARSIREWWVSTTPAKRSATGFAGVVVGALVLAAIAVAVIGVGTPEREVNPEEIAEAGRAGESEEGAGGSDPSADPFAYDPERREEFERAAAEGNAHVLYAKSPGGIIASAKRTAQWRKSIEGATKGTDVDPDTLEALVLLESAGRPEVIAGSDPAAASGLTQIVASTGLALLEMEIDLERSRTLTRQASEAAEQAAKLRRKALDSDKPKRARRQIERAERLDREALRKREQRAGIDPRFDPEQALAAAVRYLEIAQRRFGEPGLAVLSYHMGIGNLETAIERFISPGDTSGPTRELVERERLNWARIFFSTSPLRNPKTHRFLETLSDDSPTYLWRLEAAREIMRLYRDDRDELRRLEGLHANKATAEEVFHPESETEVFSGPDAIRDARRSGDLVRIPPGGDFGLKVGKQLGELAERFDERPETYRALRPEALATLIYMGSRVRAIAGGKGRLTVTSAVRDERYQEALVARNVQATPAYSLHTTGYSFDILRNYASRDQAVAFQFVLDRMQDLGVIDYAVEPAAIHVTVSERAERLLELE